MSRWLQQQVVPNYPNLTVLDVLMTSSGVSQSASTCKSWVSSNSLTHPVLRDKSGGIQSAYGMVLGDVVVVDRNLKIVFKGQVTDTLSSNQMLNVLSQLK